MSHLPDEITGFGDLLLIPIIQIQFLPLVSPGLIDPWGSAGQPEGHGHETCALEHKTDSDHTCQMEHIRTVLRGAGQNVKHGTNSGWLGEPSQGFVRSMEGMDWQRGEKKWSQR